MRHVNKGRKFHRKISERRAFIKGLEHNLVMHGKMETTLARAKEIKTKIEKLVTVAKKQDTASLRLLLRRLPKISSKKLFHEIAPRYQERRGGYTRIIHGKDRLADGAKMAIIEFV
ncbi:MAG: 50S ribosomal protein L17 [Patescibacteria group bacterium]|nr:50S ribosomal protein L17 [Patescibacteria group bacterium]MDE2437856.1 50S ribosomal protein L17 [Patescibacteria group bacterium]